MSIEDRSLDVLKEDGTTTVIDGSDDGWQRKPRWLYLDEEGYLYVDGNGSLKKDGPGKTDATEFKVQWINSDNGQIVILVYKNTSKAVAIGNGTVVTKDIPPGTLEQLNNLAMVRKAHPDILFQKIPLGNGSELFRLKPDRDDTRVLGFDTADDPRIMTTADADSKKLKNIFRIYP